MKSKVPAVTLIFWIIKISCTTLGETASDFLSINLNLGLIYTSLITGVVLMITMFLQFKSSSYNPGLYWINVVLISIFGTLITDNLTDGLGVALEISTIVFFVLLVLSFFIRYKSEGNLSIHSIYTKKREMFYWVTILITFALGTASGDLISEGLGYGYLNTGIIVFSLIVFTYILYKFLDFDKVIAFWIAYIMTRPLGASIGDYLSQSRENGGLGFGPTITSVILLSVILFTVVYLKISKKGQNIEASDDHVLNIRMVFITLVTVVTFSIGGYLFRENQLVQIAKNEISIGDSTMEIFKK